MLITLECDFEESHLCGYSNQWNANVNWYVGGGRTQLLHNNIPNDHTFNNKTGKILFKLAYKIIFFPSSGCLIVICMDGWIL